MGEFEFTTDIEHDLEKLVERGVRAIVAATEAMSRQLRETHLPEHAPRGATGALASDWQEAERDPLTRIVFPGDDAWYAHIVARGRRAVRPTRRRALTIDGEFAMHAASTTGNPFHERALAAVERRGQDLIEAALSGEGF